MIRATQIELAAAAIANERAGRRGAPAIVNVLDLLASSPKLQPLLAEVKEDAEAALEAVGLLDICEGLESAVRLIHTWHSIAMSNGNDKQAWDIYCRNAPEIQPILGALKKARGE